MHQIPYIPMTHTHTHTYRFVDVYNEEKIITNHIHFPRNERTKKKSYFFRK